MWWTAPAMTLLSLCAGMSTVCSGGWCGSGGGTRRASGPPIAERHPAQEQDADDAEADGEDEDHGEKAPSQLSVMNTGRLMS